MTPETLSEVMDATWPAAATRRVGAFLLRDGQGGGKRVSAATLCGSFAPPDIAAAESAMRATAEPALFLIRQGEAALDAALAVRGYRVVDPVLAYAAPVAAFAAPPPLAAFAHWPPLAVAAEIWAAGGIGPARLAVMHRVEGGKTALLGRLADRPAAAAFVALHGTTAMLHALEVAPPLRRRGLARHMLQAAAQWARDQGASTLSLVVTETNAPARNLYASLGFQHVGQYHYRQS